jgi:hypothetical protein
MGIQEKKEGRGKQSVPRVVPAIDVVASNQLVKLSLRRDRTLQRQPTVLALSGLVNLKSIAEPLVSSAGGDELDCAEGVAVENEGISKVRRKGWGEQEGERKRTRCSRKNRKGSG